MSVSSAGLKGSRHERAKGAADQLTGERHLVAVVAERLRVREDEVGSGETGVVVERASLEQLVRGGPPPPALRDTPAPHPHVRRPSRPYGRPRRPPPQSEA